MKILKLITLTLLVVAGNYVCRMDASCSDLNPQRGKDDGEYHVFERGIDDVGIIVENVIPASIGSISSSRHNSNHGRLHGTLHKSIDSCFSSLKTKIFRCSIVTASKLRTLYFIFALHRMRD